MNKYIIFVRLLGNSYAYRYSERIYNRNLRISPFGADSDTGYSEVIERRSEIRFSRRLGCLSCGHIVTVIAIFALAIAERFIESYSTLIMVGGGLIVTFLGCSLTFKDPFRKMKREDATPSYSLKDFFQAFIMGISNPGAILVIFALFAFFGIELEPHDFRVAPILLALSAGSACYWFFFSWVFSKMRKNFKLGTILWINRITGIIVTIIGIALLTDGIMELIFT